MSSIYPTLKSNRWKTSISSATPLSGYLRQTASISSIYAAKLYSYETQSLTTTATARISIKLQALESCWDCLLMSDVYLVALC